MRILSILSMTALALVAQSVPTSSNVTLTSEPPREPWTMLVFGSNPIYMCRAPAWATSSSWSVSASTLTSIAVSSGVATVTTASAHGMFVDAAVAISGSTTASMNTTAVVASVPSSTTFTLNKVLADGTYNNTALTVTTAAPRTSTANWTILKIYNNGSDTTVRQSRPSQICDNRAETGANMIAYH